ncbi:MAG: LptF/LptG family permease, partial [Kaistella sp.]
MTKSFGHPPEELFPDVLLGQNKTTPELIKFIDREKEKGNANLNSYLNELYQRTSMPLSVIILTFLGLSLSSQKKRGGLGANLAIGIALAFVFVFSFEVLKVVSENKTLTPLLAMWLPNIVFGPVALYLYFKRANQ